MHVFGDGYYWSKWTGSSASPQWAEHPPGIGWGRRKRRAVQLEPNRNVDMAELIFEKLDINGDACRRRIVYAPTGWTVALYIWYIVKLGFILGALLLLLFAKKWKSQSPPIIVEGGPEYYHHRSLDAAEQSLFQHSRSRRELKLYWKDRMDAIAATLGQ
uniref:Uncharacterized protein n=1 Tax=Anopheles dirus TaxID=7168 RepID=A0A182NJE2_9DIPT